MKQIKSAIVLVLMFLFVVTNFIQAKEQYWLTIKKHLLEYDEAKTIEEHQKAEQTARKYLDTLSVEQLIEAGRQCSREADAKDPGTTYCKETLYIAGFFGDQFPKAGGFNNLDLVFKEIDDKHQTNLWRSVLIDLLDSSQWVKLLTKEQKYTVIEKMQVVLADKTEHYVVRYEASGTIRHLLGNLEARNLRDDSAIQEKEKGGEELRILKKEIAEGKIMPSDNYQTAQAKTMEYWNYYAQTLLPILDESNLEPALLRDTLAGLCDCLKKPIESAPLIQNTLESTVRNYQEFSPEEWDYLAKIGIGTLKLPDAVLTAKKMLNDSREMYEKQYDRKSKKKIKLRIEDLEGIIKKQNDKCLSGVQKELD